jgi:hypothetical protein
MMILRCFSYSAADDGIYRRFSIMIDTNEAADVSSLVDTNNTGFKLTNDLPNLVMLKNNRQLAGVRLGMTMEDVVARWGKPYILYPKCYGGGPRFWYDDAMVDFEPGSNSVKTIMVEAWPDSARPRPAGPTLEDCVRIFGKPARREHSNAETNRCALTYVTTNSVIKFECSRSRVYEIELGRLPTPIRKEDL